MKFKTLLTLLCVLGVGIVIGVAVQFYCGSLPTTAAAPSSQTPDHAHASDQVVSLAQDDVERYAIEVGTAAPGQVDVHVRVPGQIVINTDRVAHIMPNAAGVVRQVLKI
ncbi:MAG: hypothetical protein ACYTFQ_15030 [Planctomycetota bacterium]|jgi:multidrug efflux pump subunit AcrA (membrane-fusion protein)